MVVVVSPIRLHRAVETALVILVVLVQRKSTFFKNIIARVIGGAWVFALFVAV
jgi:hypothetical protein